MKKWRKFTRKSKCDRCGKLFDAYIYNLKRGWGKFCSTSCSKKNNKNRLGKNFTLETRNKISETLRRKIFSGEIKSPLLEWYGKKPRVGKESPNWRGGKTLIGQMIRMSKEYKE